MKLYYFLVTFAVANAKIDEEAECKKEVFLTNAGIELAYNLSIGGNSGKNGLECVIEKIVNSTSHLRRSFAKINYMIAVPEKTEIINEIPEFHYFSLMTKCSHYQYAMQRQIINTLNIAIPKPDNRQNFRELNLETLANERREYVVQALRNMLRRELGSMYNQFMLQIELTIRDTMTNEVQDLEGLNLTALVEERRVTGISIENIITRVLGRDIPEVPEDQYGSYVCSDDDVPSLRMCRLIGLYLSTQYPKSYIRKLQINSNDNSCILWDGRKQKIYRKVDGVWEHTG